MNITALSQQYTNKIDDKNIADEIIAQDKQQKLHEQYSTQPKVYSLDSHDSAPAIEYYNNYSPKGTLYLYASVQQTAYAETLPTSSVTATAVDVIDTTPVNPDEPLSEIDRLVQALRDNEEYMRLINGPHGKSRVGHLDLQHIPEWRELGLHIIKNLSSEDYELLQKMLWSSIVWTHNDEAWRDTPNGLMFFNDAHSRSMDGRQFRPLKGSHTDYDLVSIWNNMGDLLEPTNSVNEQLGRDLEFHLRSFLGLKMRAEGLSEAERAFYPRFVDMEERFGPDATFGNRMTSVADYVNMRFSEARQQLNSGERFTFRFNSNFSFNVSGGTGNNAEFMQGIFNNAGGWLLSHVIDVLFLHRGENGEVPPWLATNHEHDLWRIVAEDRGLGFIQASQDFLDELERVRSAYARKLTEDWMQERFGFGLDDLIYEDGVLSGRTQEITDVINNNRVFEQILYESRTKLCASIYDALNTPSEQDLSFISIVFENGVFSISHQ
jgi:hypothetical protein